MIPVGFFEEQEDEEKVQSPCCSHHPTWSRYRIHRCSKYLQGFSQLKLSICLSGSEDAEEHMVKKIRNWVVKKLTS
jgi:hypothetical protein